MPAAAANTSPSGPPCPGCGRATAPGAAYCASCGRSLNVPPTGPFVPGPPPPPDLSGSQSIQPLGAGGPFATSPPPPGGPPNRADIPTRPLNPEESDQISRLVRSPGATAAGMVGLFAGLASATLSVTYFLGVVYNPTNFFILVLGAGLVALIAGGVASGMVRPPRGALRYGRAVELNGIPSRDSLKVFGHVGYLLGPIRLVIPTAQSGAIRVGEPQRLVVALGVHPMRTPGFGLVPRGVLLNVNGSPVPKPPIIFVSW
jgi:hypothetical protein